MEPPEPRPYAVGAVRPPSSSGLGRRPFTAVARVRIPLGVQPGDVLARLGECRHHGLEFHRFASAGYGEVLAP